jgi:hypothetical protein
MTIITENSDAKNKNGLPVYIGCHKGGDYLLIAPNGHFVSVPHSEENWKSVKALIKTSNYSKENGRICMRCGGGGFASPFAASGSGFFLKAGRIFAPGSDAAALFAPRSLSSIDEAVRFAMASGRYPCALSLRDAAPFGPFDTDQVLFEDEGCHRRMRELPKDWKYAYRAVATTLGEAIRAGIGIDQIRTERDDKGNVMTCYTERCVIVALNALEIVGLQHGRDIILRDKVWPEAFSADDAPEEGIGTSKWGKTGSGGKKDVA